MLKIVCLLIASLVMGPAIAPWSSPRPASQPSADALAHGVDPDLVAYAALRQPLAPGCTPVLRRWANGDITFYGCPTSNCAPGNGDCQVDGSDSDEILSCMCQTGNVDCKGVAAISEEGLVTDWTCFQKDCGGACTDVAAPPAPPVGSTDFYACDC